MRYLIPVLFLLSSCSPLKTSFHDGGHQWELTIHEVQTNLDDLRHDLNCFRAEMQILEGRVRTSETTFSSLKQQDFEKHKIKIDQMAELSQALEKKWALFEKKQKEEMEKWVGYTGKTSSVLTQFNERIEELEKEIISQNRKLDALVKLKGNIEVLAQSLQPLKSYKVRSGDSLEKIAKMHKVDVSRLKQANHLNSDLIVVGQELTIPE